MPSSASQQSKTNNPSSSSSFSDWSAHIELLLRCLTFPDPSLSLGLLARDGRSLLKSVINGSISSSNNSHNNSNSQQQELELGPLIFAPLLSIVDTKFFSGFKNQHHHDRGDNDEKKTLFGSAIADVLFLNDQMVCTMCDEIIANNSSNQKKDEANNDNNSNNKNIPLSTQSLVNSLPFFLQPASANAKNTDADEVLAIQRRDAILVETILLSLNAIQSISSSSSSLKDVSQIRLFDFMRRDLVEICANFSRFVLHAFFAQVLSSSSSSSSIFIDCEKQDRRYNLYLLRILNALLNLLQSSSFSFSGKRQVKISRANNNKKNNAEEETDETPENNQQQQIQLSKNLSLLLLVLSNHHTNQQEESSSSSSDDEKITTSTFILEFLNLSQVTLLMSTKHKLDDEQHHETKFRQPLFLVLRKIHMASLHHQIEMNKKQQQKQKQQRASASAAENGSIEQDIQQKSFQCLFTLVSQQESSLQSSSSSFFTSTLSPNERQPAVLISEIKTFINALSSNFFSSSSSYSEFSLLASSNTAVSSLLINSLFFDLFDNTVVAAGDNNNNNNTTDYLITKRNDHCRTVTGKLLQEFLSPLAMSENDNNNNTTHKNNSSSIFVSSACTVILLSLQNSSSRLFNFAEDSSEETRTKQDNFIRNFLKGMITLFVKAVVIFASKDNSNNGNNEKQQYLMTSVVDSFRRSFIEQSEREFFGSSSNKRKNSWRMFAANLLKHLLTEGTSINSNGNNNNNNNNNNTLIVTNFLANLCQSLIIPLIAETRDELRSILGHEKEQEEESDDEVITTLATTSSKPVAQQLASNKKSTNQQQQKQKSLAKDATEVSIWIRDLLTGQMASSPSSCSLVIDSVIKSVLMMVTRRNNIIITSSSSINNNSLSNNNNDDSPHRLMMRPRLLIIAKELLSSPKLVVRDEEQQTFKKTIRPSIVSEVLIFPSKNSDEKKEQHSSNNNKETIFDQLALFDAFLSGFLASSTTVTFEARDFYYYQQHQQQEEDSPPSLLSFLGRHYELLLTSITAREEERTMMMMIAKRNNNKLMRNDDNEDNGDDHQIVEESSTTGDEHERELLSSCYTKLCTVLKQRTKHVKQFELFCRKFNSWIMKYCPRNDDNDNTDDNNTDENQDENDNDDGFLPNLSAQNANISSPVFGGTGGGGHHHASLAHAVLGGNTEIDLGMPIEGHQSHHHHVLQSSSSSSNNSKDRAYHLQQIMSTLSSTSLVSVGNQEDIISSHTNNDDLNSSSSANPVPETKKTSLLFQFSQAISLLSRVHVFLINNNKKQKKTLDVAVATKPPLQKELFDGVYLKLLTDVSAMMNNTNNPIVSDENNNNNNESNCRSSTAFFSLQEKKRLLELQACIEEGIRASKISGNNENQNNKILISRDSSSSSQLKSNVGNIGEDLCSARVHIVETSSSSSTAIKITFENISTCFSSVSKKPQNNNSNNETLINKRNINNNFSSDDEDEVDSTGENNRGNSYSSSMQYTTNLISRNKGHSYFRDPFLILGIAWQLVMKKKKSNGGACSEEEEEEVLLLDCGLQDFSSNPLASEDTFEVSSSVFSAAALASSKINSSTTKTFTLSCWIIGTSLHQYHCHLMMNGNDSSKSSIMQKLSATALIRKIEQDQMPLVKGAARFREILESCFVNENTDSSQEKASSKIQGGVFVRTGKIAVV